MTKPNKTSLFLEPICGNEVLCILANSTKNSHGWDGLETFALKEISTIIAPPLAHIINLSFEHGIVPMELKIARVFPLYKSGDEKIIKNYRPISVLPTISKLFELNSWISVK